MRFPAISTVSTPVSMRCARLFAIACLALSSAANAAGWGLDGSKSSLSFMTTKAVDVGEVHGFDGLSGSVDGKGKAQLVIDLASVNTAIPIRDERMQKLLFQTDRFPRATLSTTVPIAQLAALKAGELSSVTLEGSLDIRGRQVPVSSEASVIKLSDGSLQVIGKKPILLKAADLDLATGVEELRKVAGLASIGQTVSVSYDLNFRQ